jgi:lipopolysaccharide export system permease protein
LKKLYGLVLKELFGPWVFGVAIFTTLIVTITYLFQLTEMVVRGVSLGTVLYMAVLFMPAILVKTFAMAVLLASLLAFSRLSGDSEIVALRAAGISIGRIMIPVAVFGLAIAAVAFWVNEQVAPAATQRAEGLKAELAKLLRAEDMNPTGYPIRDKNRKLIAQLNARDFLPASKTLRGVTVIVFDPKTGKSLWYLQAPEMVFRDEMSDKDWKITKGASLVAADGSSYTQLDSFWPKQVPKIGASPEDILAAMTKNLDNYSMREFRQQIVKAKKDGIPASQVANLEYGYYNRIALPLAVFVFGLLGAPLGIRNHRSGVAAGYMISIVIIFGYFLLANLMAVFATRGGVPPAAASFAPVVVGFLLAAVTIHRRNQS